MKHALLELFFLCCLPLAQLQAAAVSNDLLSLSEYYNDAFLGEKKTTNYFGPLDPRSTASTHTGNLVLLDDVFKETYINEQIQGEAFDLYDYWFSEVVEKSACPDVVLSENVDYIRYLYRLVTMSYLFEGLKLSHKLGAELGDKNICAISYKDVFGGCSPQSNDMKQFHSRVYGKFVNEIDKLKYQSFSKKETEAFIDGFRSSTSLTTDPLYSRLHDWCFANKKNCRTLSADEIKSALGNFCKDDKESIQLICSEKDSFYGLSQAEKASELIRSSNAFNLINQTGMGEECLRRYGKLFSAKEEAYPLLVKQYPLLYSHLLKSGSRYMQGELFLPGALKEFDMKGLSDFLTALKPPKVEPVVVKIKPRPKPAPKPVPVVVEAPKPVVKEPTPAPVAPEPPKVKISEFERAFLEVHNGASEVKFDMDVFRDDFEFTPEMVAELSGPIKKFQTRAALVDMKAYDLLGSHETPVGLVFIKFLIDAENHQGLYNITTVLGEKFYVVNDLENKKAPAYIQLKNDASTGNRWQIIMLKNPKK